MQGKGSEIILVISKGNETTTDISSIKIEPPAPITV